MCQIEKRESGLAGQPKSNMQVKCIAVQIRRPHGRPNASVESPVSSGISVFPAQEENL